LGRQDSRVFCESGVEIWPIRANLDKCGRASRRETLEGKDPMKKPLFLSLELLLLLSWSWL
jgi:hypothetical protein